MLVGGRSAAVARARAAQAVQVRRAAQRAWACAAADDAAGRATAARWLAFASYLDAMARARTVTAREVFL